MDAEKNYEDVSFKLPEVEVPPCSSANIVSPRLGPRSIFRPSGFDIPDDVARCFFITDVKVGNDSQFCSGGVVPAELFAASTPEARVVMNVLSGGMQITVSVTNLTDRPAMFRGRVRGVRKDAFSENPKADHLPVLIGLGSNVVPAKGKLTVNAQAIFKASPVRLYVPPALLRDVDVTGFTSEQYLDEEAASCVPGELLTAKWLSTSGKIQLSPCAVLPKGTFFTVHVANRCDQPRNFSGAVLLERA